MIFYRYVGIPIYSYDEDVENLMGVEILCEEYEVIRETAKGRWVQKKGQRYPTPKKHFVLDRARKKFAYPEKELAIDSLRHRAKWRISHLVRQLESAKAISRHIESLVFASQEQGK